MSLKGSLGEAGLADILQLLSLGGKTGCLSVTDGQNVGHVHLLEGRVVHADLVDREDRLGRRLLAEGRLAAADLSAALAEQNARPERRLGELLVERGSLTAQELGAAVGSQIEDAVHHLFGWQRGSFAFQPGREAAASESLVALEVSSLLMEGARRADEWARVRRTVPHARIIPALVAAGADPQVEAQVRDAPAGGDEPPRREGRGEDSPELRERERAAVVAVVDGQRDVNAIVARTGLDELRVFQVLHELLVAGRLAIRGESPSPPGDSLRTRDEYRKLGLAFYDTRMYDEAAREFRQMLAVEPGDGEARFHLGRVAFRTGRFAEAFDEFRRHVEQAPASVPGHLNLALTLEALERPEEAQRVLLRLLDSHPDCGAARLHLGILGYAGGRYAEALALLEGLEVEEDLQPIAQFYRGMLHALVWDLRTAREELAAIPPARRNGRVLVNLGAVLERGDRLEEARLSYAAALEFGGVASLARKNLGDLQYREGRYEQARSSYGLALQQDPANAAALHRLGRIAAREGRMAEAIGLWEKAVETDPGYTRARESLSAASAQGS
ncbi:MAG: tetratricopeptide repeat protein [Gemmatimonadetes bacterium]|nr:tetratricopeptide repeat protein [Gemmatimonadota bacterium]